MRVPSVKVTQCVEYAGRGIPPVGAFCLEDGAQLLHGHIFAGVNTICPVLDLWRGVCGVLIYDVIRMAVWKRALSPRALVNGRGLCCTCLWHVFGGYFCLGAGLVIHVTYWGRK